MCGRCIILTYNEVLEIVQAIEARSPISGIDLDTSVPRAQAYPGSVAPLIIPRFDTFVKTNPLEPGNFEVCELAWGFDESWKSGVVFNTRIESAMKPTWRDSMEHRRCLIPVSAFFETSNTETYPSPKTGKSIKRPYEFRNPRQNVMLIGCIWKGERFSMVTTEANADMAPIHHRMPLIVRPNELSLWFGPDYRQLADRSSVRLAAQPASL